MTVVFLCTRGDRAVSRPWMGWVKATFGQPQEAAQVKMRWNTNMRARCMPGIVSRPDRCRGVKRTVTVTRLERATLWTGIRSAKPLRHTAAAVVDKQLRLGSSTALFVCSLAWRVVTGGRRAWHVRRLWSPGVEQEARMLLPASGGTWHGLWHFDAMFLQSRGLKHSCDTG
jgi:hypothetical protein